MLYLGRSSCLEENMRFLICYSCCAECQTDTTTHVSITATSKALHKQLNKQCEIQDYLQFEQKKVNKGRCSSLFIHNSFTLSPFVGVGGGGYRESEGAASVHEFVFFYMFGEIIQNL